MKDLLWHWVPMFLACGKHKYATHLSKFLWDLHTVYPSRLAGAIENNWLCNPTGTVNGFRGVDWWIELNNLYTKVSYITQVAGSKVIHSPPKVIFCRSSSNRNLTHIINQSSLIELYHSVHINITNNFAIAPRTTHHTQANMTNTLDALQTEIRRHGCHTHQQCSTTALEVPNMLVARLTEFLLSKTQQEDSVEGAEMGAVIEEDDFDAL